MSTLFTIQTSRLPFGHQCDGDTIMILGADIMPLSTGSRTPRRTNSVSMNNGLGLFAGFTEVAE